MKHLNLFFLFSACLLTIGCQMDNPEDNYFEEITPIEATSSEAHAINQALNQNYSDDIIAKQTPLHFVINSLYHWHDLGFIGNPGINFDTLSLLVGYIPTHSSNDSLSHLSLSYNSARDLYSCTITIQLTSSDTLFNHILPYWQIFPSVTSEVIYQINYLPPSTD